MEEITAKSSYHPQHLEGQRAEVIMTKTEKSKGETNRPKT